MTASNHALTGAIIAIVVKQPALAIPLAFAAHFAMDAIPHFGFNDGTNPLQRKKNDFWVILLFDCAITLALLIFVPLMVTTIAPWVTFACMFACISPDLVWGFRLAMELKTKLEPTKNLFSRFHKRIQWSETPRGAIVEGLWFMGVGLLIFNLQ